MRPISPCAARTRATRRQPRFHLSATLLSKPVTMLTVKELKNWRNGLVTAGVKATTVNRIVQGVEGRADSRASLDGRVANAKAWTAGLAAIPEDDDTGSNIVLTDDQRRGVVNAAYAISAGFGSLSRCTPQPARAWPDRVARCGRS